MYSIYNEGKSVIPERFISTLKNKTFKHMTALSKHNFKNVQMFLELFLLMMLLLRTLITTNAILLTDLTIISLPLLKKQRQNQVFSLKTLFC